MTGTLGLTALGIANCLGVGKAQVAGALFQGSRDGLRPRDGFIPGRTVHVGAIEAAHLGVHELLAAFANTDAPPHNCIAVDARHALYAADA